MNEKEHDCCNKEGMFGFGFHPPPPPHGHHPPPPRGPGAHHPPPPFGFGANFRCGQPPFGPKFKDMGILNMLSSLFLDPNMAEWNPFIKIEERENEFKVKALVPGFEKDQIQLSVKGAELLVEAKREQPEEEETEDTFMEALRFWDKTHMEYLIPLSEDIDPTKIKAKLSQGILNITIERKKPENVKIE